MSAIIEVVVLACSIVQGAACKEFTLSFNPSAKYGVEENAVVADAPVTPLTCNRYGQMAIKDWAAINPNWSLQRWHCNRTAVQAKA